MLGITILLSIVNYYVVIGTFFVMLAFGRLRRFYLKTARDLKRLESVSTLYLCRCFCPILKCEEICLYFCICVRRFVHRLSSLVTKHAWLDVPLGYSINWKFSKIRGQSSSWKYNEFLSYIPSLKIATSARSPVFSHLSASLNGLAIIRASHAENIFTQEFDNHQVR